MVRKRLSDLLREEGEKRAGGEAGDPGETTQVKNPEQSGATPKDSEAIDVTAKVVAAEVIAPNAPQPPAIREESQPETPQPAASEPAASEPKSLQLEATVLRLKQDIEVAKQLTQEAAAVFNQQIAVLQAKITEQDSIIQQLKSESEAASQQATQQATQLKAELETARQTILQLSQAKPPTLPPTLPAAPARPGFLSRSQPPTLPAVLPSPRAAEPELEPSQSQMIIPGRASKPVPDRSSRHELELHKVFDHPTQPGSLPLMSSEPKPAGKESIKLSDNDVGWMD